jgi:hypothetical protein
MARIRHTPSPPLVTRLLDAAEPQLTSFTADNIATLVWGLAEVAPDAPVTLFMVRMGAHLQAALQLVALPWAVNCMVISILMSSLHHSYQSIKGMETGARSAVHEVFHQARPGIQVSGDGGGLVGATLSMLVERLQEAVVSETQERLLEFNPHDLVSLLSALAK